MTDLECLARRLAWIELAMTVRRKPPRGEWFYWRSMTAEARAGFCERARYLAFMVRKLSDDTEAWDLLVEAQRELALEENPAPIKVPT